MSLKKCEHCGVYFGPKADEKFCLKCTMVVGDKNVAKEDYDYHKYSMVKEYVMLNGNVTPEEIIDYMDEQGIEITRKEIMTYVDEGKLVLVALAGKHHCETCKAEIPGGRFCVKCRNKLESNLGIKPNEHKNEQPKDKKHQGMYIANTKK